MTKSDVMRPRKSGYDDFSAKRQAKITKRTRLPTIFCLFHTNRCSVYSINSAIGSRIDRILFHSFRNQNRSPKKTVNSLYSNSRIVPKEHALSWSCNVVKLWAMTPTGFPVNHTAFQHAEAEKLEGKMGNNGKKMWKNPFQLYTKCGEVQHKWSKIGFCFFVTEEPQVAKVNSEQRNSCNVLNMYWNAIKVFTYLLDCLSCVWGRFSGDLCATGGVKSPVNRSKERQSSR